MQGGDKELFSVIRRFFPRKIVREEKGGRGHNGKKVGGETGEGGDSKDACTDLRKLNLNLAPTEEEKLRENP